jgi:putative effector of murein hydrolase
MAYPLYSERNKTTQIWGGLTMGFIIAVLVVVILVIVIVKLT